MPPTIQSVAASLTEKAIHDLVAVANATPEDKVTWRPAPDVRPVLEQLVECCLANQMWADILRTHIHALLPDGVASRAYEELDTLPRVTQHLQVTGSRLIGIIRGLPDAALPIIVAFPWKPREGRPIAECCLHACWNMTYHLGQISYIQTLYGDQEEHCNAGPFGEL